MPLNRDMSAAKPFRYFDTKKKFERIFLKISNLQKGCFRAAGLPAFCLARKARAYLPTYLPAGRRYLMAGDGRRLPDGRRWPALT
jgi:hypothetical protein